jgi:hypothetical protein|tara:strand:+ start:3593 stop:3901 length:309 start_codon:yes stop_codon:yes gene_type:complete
MMPRNNLHSFTLWPQASDIVSDTQHGRKSQLVSKAIIWFSTPREVIVEDGGIVRMVNMSEQIMAHESLMKRYNQVCKENVKLREECKKNESFITKMLKLFRK